MIFLITGGGNCVDTVSFFNFKEKVKIFDDNKTGKILGCKICGTIDNMIDMYHKMLFKPKVINCLGSSGNNSQRNSIYEKLRRAGIKTSPLLMASFISNGVQIGENVLLGLNSQLHHGVIVGDNTVISPNATILGEVKIGNNVFIGSCAVLKQGITVHSNAIIGMGSVVLNDCEPNSVYVGNPARRIRS